MSTEDKKLHGIAFGSAHQVIKYIRFLINNNITLSVDPSLDLTKPSLLCANHFTRIETFLMPSFLYQKLDLRVRSLADKGLFKGGFGDYLASTGTLSTDHPDRDRIILSDIIKGSNSWNIYPEGRMMKNKKVTFDQGRFILHEPKGEHPLYTGAAVLGLKTELVKRAIRHAKQNDDKEEMHRLRLEYDIGEDEDIAYESTQMVPVTITYFPIRPGTNNLMDLARNFFDLKEGQTAEELEIESNLLLYSDMHIHLGAPLDVGKFVRRKIKEFELIHTSFNESRFIEENRHELITLVMERVYRNTYITFDHIFALVLEHYSQEHIRMSHLKLIIFMVVRELHALNVYHLHEMMQRDFYKLLTDEPFEMFNSACFLATSQSIMSFQSDGSFKIDKEALSNPYTFTDVRIKNTFRIILDEVALMSDLTELVKQQIAKPLFRIEKEVSDTLLAQDLKRYDYAYKRFYSLLESKPKSIGAPFMLYNPDFEKGMVISHGYKAAPKEIEAMARFVHDLGYNIYGVRLEGHGTTPEDLKECTYTQWIESFNRGFAAMRPISKKLYLCGFSAGGLITLITAGLKEHKIDGIICINSAIEINDMRFNYLLPTLGALNSWLALINANVEYVKDTPENPDINYNMHYIRSIAELKKLIEVCKENLALVTAPALIIQGTHDPVVSANSAQIIYEGISSKVKEIQKIEAQKHVIVTTPQKEEVFAHIERFLKEH